MTPEALLRDAEPFDHTGGEHGVLVLHGFTGSPQSVKPLAKWFAEAGFSVSAPLLPGHGTTVEDMLATGWTDWSNAAERAYLDLASRCSRIVVAGLSMGGTLTTWLALRHPEIAGIVTINPLIDARAPLWSGLVAAGRHSDAATLPALGSDIAMPGVVESAYDAVPVAGLESVTAAVLELASDPRPLDMPALIFVSLHDHVVDPASAHALAARCTGTTIVRELGASYHVATLDYEAEEIASESLAFARACTSEQYPR
ncbi:alpha/beta fold hydrolase [Nocardia asteroides]|uniref:alpha/beta hydrolase n=1 Tax=Nocardia asteroides TaxID=1824 RepID=UPI00342B661E